MQQRLSQASDLRGYGALGVTQTRTDNLQPFSLPSLSPGIQSEAAVLASLKPYGALAGPRPVRF